MYRIKEVSQRTGVLSHTLRYWEKEFGILLAPSRSEGKHRFYSDDDVERVALIRKLLKDDGYSIQGAKRYLEAISPAAVRTNGDGNGNGHPNGNGNGNGHHNGNGNGNGHTEGLPDSLVDRIASAVAKRVAEMIHESDGDEGGLSEAPSASVPPAAAGFSK